MGLVLGPTALIEADPEVISCTLGEGSALLDMRTGTYFSVNAVGAFVWSLLAKPIKISDVRAAIGEQFDVDAETCAADLTALLDDLSAADLIRVADERSG